MGCNRLLSLVISWIELASTAAGLQSQLVLTVEFHSSIRNDCKVGRGARTRERVRLGWGFIPRVKVRFFSHWLSNVIIIRCMTNMPVSDNFTLHHKLAFGSVFLTVHLTGAPFRHIICRPTCVVVIAGLFLSCQIALVYQPHVWHSAHIVMYKKLPFVWLLHKKTVWSQKLAQIRTIYHLVKLSQIKVTMTYMSCWRRKFRKTLVLLGWLARCLIDGCNGLTNTNVILQSLQNI